MAASSLLALIDDIATVLDDVAVMSKVAAKKTAGVLGDDLALNAQQVAGVRADREIPVVMAVAWGSMRNKAILVPLALAISAFLPWAITPLLMLGGAFLCFEGFEKLAHKFLHADEAEAHHAEQLKVLTDPAADILAFEQDKIKGAVRTDFVLSAEIMAITLGTVAQEPFMKQVAVLTVIALVMTIGVYGFVAAIVKLDDGGLHLSRQAGEGAWPALQRRMGGWVLAAAPILMKTLSVVGTAAMFMVGGGILTHGIPALHDLSHALAQAVDSWPGVGALLAGLLPTLVDAMVGLIAGALCLAGFTAIQRLRGKGSAPHA